jgi:hypothetical protein
MARIYISSSWRNGSQPKLVKELRERGHLVYDFRHPQGRNDCNVWDGIVRSRGLKEAYLEGILQPTDFDEMMHDKRAYDRFEDHFTAMADADTCVIVLPSGRSSHVEAGYFAGAGKRVFVMDYGANAKPELMYLIFDGYFYDEEKLLKAVDQPQYGVCHVCGCTEENHCYHPDFGNCWWVDENHTLCSHCAEKFLYGGEWHPSIRKDPKTQHCIHDIGKAFKIL